MTVSTATMVKLNKICCKMAEIIGCIMIDANLTMVYN